MMLGVAFSIAPTSVLAEAQVGGSPENVRIEAKDTSVEEILAGLDTALNVHHRSSAKLDNRLNGTFEGSLHNVMKRLLEGYDFIVKTGNGEIQVTVLGRSTATAASSSIQLSGRPMDASSAQLPPTLAVVEPRVLSASAAAVPVEQPPAPGAVRPHASSTPAAHSFRRHHRGYLLARASGSLQSPPGKIRIAGGAWRRSLSHVRSKGFAHRLIFCCGRSSPFGLMMSIPVRSHSLRRWEASCCAVRIPFDRSRWWLPRSATDMSSAVAIELPAASDAVGRRRKQVGAIGNVRF
jgi:hypothetical protein